MSSRTRLSFKVQVNKAGETIDLSIADPSKISANNLALATWGSSEVLANVLHRIDVDLQGTETLHKIIPVLELGAGTGLVGLTAAAVWGTNAILTDLPPILPNIKDNIVLNRNVLAHAQGIAICGLLDWTHPEDLTIDEVDKGVNAPPYPNTAAPARVILAADTIYSEEHPELLTNVIKCRLEPGQLSRFVMCYPLRIGYLDHIRDLWQRLEDAGLECIEEGREELDQSWEEDTPYEWCVWRWRD